MRKFWNFLQYHNAVPIGLFILFGTGGVALAATPQVQQAVYSSQDTVKGVDNTYLVSVDLSHYDFGLKITDIKEDTDNYYVSYAYKTITIVDYVWKQSDVSKTMTLSKKEVLGHDLGVMVQKQLAEEVTGELSYLTQAQDKERKLGTSVRTVTTTYSGLIGARLDPTTKEFPGYVPVVADTSLPPELAGAIAAVGPGDQTSHIALPPIPSQADIAKLVQDAVTSALASAGNTTASSTVAVATPPPDTNTTTNTPPSSGGSSSTSSSSGTTTPPDTTSTSTPPVSTPPATTTPPDTGTSTSTPPSTNTTPPQATSTPPADQTPPPATQPDPAPADTSTPPAASGNSSSTPQS